MKNSLFVALALFALSTAISLAEPKLPPTPPNAPYHLTTVSWIIATRDNIDKDDRYVTLIGHVTKKEGDETYYFTDGTGTIKLDSEAFELPVGAKIVVGGRIDQAYFGWGDLEVDVRHWHYPKAK